VDLVYAAMRAAQVRNAEALGLTPEQLSAATSDSTYLRRLNHPKKIIPIRTTITNIVIMVRPSCDRSL